MEKTPRRLDVESAKKELVTEFSNHREVLWQAIYQRLDHRLFGRIDPDDVLQEAFLDASARLSQFVEQQESWTLLVWIRVVLKQTLVNVHRRHFAAKKRDASREVFSDRAESSSESRSIADRIVGRVATPSQLAMRRESVAGLQQAIDRLKPADREILRMRHFEELSNKEVASRLLLSEKASSIRYVRAFERLRKSMAQAVYETADCEN